MRKNNQNWEGIISASEKPTFDVLKLEKFISSSEISDNLDPVEKTRLNKVIGNIIRWSPDEETAIKLLQLIHSKDKTKCLIKNAGSEDRASFIFSALCNYKENQFSLANFLIDKIGVDVDKRDCYNLTALYLLTVEIEGIKNYSEDFIENKVRLLISKGANPLIKNENGECLFDLVKSELIKSIMRQSPFWSKDIKKHETKYSYSLVGSFYPLLTAFSDIFSKKSHSEYKIVQNFDEEDKLKNKHV